MRRTNPTTASARGRPKAFDRSLALNVAMDLFLSRGYEGTSVADLVQAMEISPSSLYATFGSKESLYQEALELYLSTRGRFVTRGLEKDLPIEQQVRLILEDAATAFTPRNGSAPGCMVSSDLLLCAPKNAAVADNLKRIRTASIAAVTRRIDEAKRQRQISKKIDSKSLARFFAALVTGMAVQARDGTTRKELREMIDIAMKSWPPS